MTTESLAQYLHERVATGLPIRARPAPRARGFFRRILGREGYFLGLQTRLQCGASPAARRAYPRRKTWRSTGSATTRAGTAIVISPRRRSAARTTNGAAPSLSFTDFAPASTAALEPWQNKHLDLETEEFRDRPSTGENIVRALWPKLDAQLNERLVRLRLWETPNNRFTLRR